MNSQQFNYNSSNLDNDLLDIHTKALEENSRSVVEILELLTNKKLSVENRKALKKIERELTNTDEKIDCIYYDLNYSDLYDKNKSVSKDLDEEEWW